jgi:uncharacterized membrane protein
MMSFSEKPQYTKFDIIPEAISIITLLTLFIFTYYLWPSVPEKIPNHFSFSGVPNSWGLKGALPTLVYVSVFIFLLFTVLSRFPRAINFPVKVNEENSKSHLQLRFSLILWIKAELVLATTYIGMQGMRIALGQSQGLGEYFGPIMLIVLIITGAIYIYRAAQLK